MRDLIFYVNISGLRKGANHEEIWLSQNKYKRTAFRQRYQRDYSLLRAEQSGTEKDFYNQRNDEVNDISGISID